MKKQKVIVTGGCGFIGSHIVDALVNLECDVYVIDNESAESNEKFYYNDKANYFREDINERCFDHMFHKAKCVFHLAAESRIGPCINNPRKAVDTNIVGTLNLLEYARQYKIERFIYSSTSAVYGLECPLPTDENAPINCLNPYSTTKYGGESMVQLYNKMYNLDTCVFRYFNVFGERSPTKGVYAPVLGIFLKQLSENTTLTVVGDGEQRRDFIHVKDVAQANILAMLCDKKIKGQIFNVGSGINYSVNEIANSISKDIEYLPDRPGEARDTLANIGSISGFLGWNPTINVMEWIKEKL